MSNDSNKIPYIADFEDDKWKKLSDSQNDSPLDKDVQDLYSDKIKDSDIPTIADIEANKKTLEKKKKDMIPSLDDVIGKTPPSKPDPNSLDCKALQKKDTTFVFVYGSSQSGKTCFMVSLLNYLSSDKEGRLESRRSNEDDSAQKILREIERDFKSKRQVPKPSDTKNVYELDFIYTPNNPKIPAKFTFLEMSGERLEEIHLLGKGYQQLPKFIDKYLSCPSVKLCFIMLVPHDADETEEKPWIEIDYGLQDFINYIKSKDIRFDKSNMLCLVSKWDSYDGDCSNVHEFMEKNLPKTYQQLNARNNQIGTYSIGEVIKARDKNNKVVDYIRTFNEDHPRKVKNWLYEAITKRQITSKPWYVRLGELLKM